MKQLTFIGNNNIFILNRETPTVCVGYADMVAGIPVSPPRFTGALVTPQTVPHNAPFTIDVGPHFVTGGPVAKYQLVGFPPGFTIDALGVITGSATTLGNYPGAHVVATNASGHATTNQVVFHVTDSPVFVGGISDIFASVGKAFQLDISRHFPSGSPVVTYALVNAPLTMMIDSHGVIHYAPTAPLVTTGLKVTATTAAGTAESNLFNAIAEAAPVFTGVIPDMFLLKGVAMTPVDVSKKVTAPITSPLHFTMIGAPAWMRISAQGLITGTPDTDTIVDGVMVVAASSSARTNSNPFRVTTSAVIRDGSRNWRIVITRYGSAVGSPGSPAHGNHAMRVEFRTIPGRTFNPANTIVTGRNDQGLPDTRYSFLPYPVVAREIEIAGETPEDFRVQYSTSDAYNPPEDTWVTVGNFHGEVGQLTYVPNQAPQIKLIIPIGTGPILPLNHNPNGLPYPIFVGAIPNIRANTLTPTTVDVSGYFTSGAPVEHYYLTNAPAGASIDDNGIITFAPGSAGNLSGVQVVGSTSVEHAVSNVFSMDAVLALPIFDSPISPVSITQGHDLNYPMALHFDTGGPVDAYTLEGTIPPGMVIDAATGILSGLMSTLGSYPTVTVVATNAAGEARGIFELDVIALVAVPQWHHPLPDIHAKKDEPWSLNISSHFALGGAITSYSLQGAPAWMSINNAGVMSGTPTDELKTTGVTVTGTNESGNAVSNQFSVDEAVGFSYWRVLITKSARSDAANYHVVQLAEVEFREVAGVPQQATGGVASASGALDATSHGADNAFDGATLAEDTSTDTMWYSGSRMPQWIQYMFAHPMTVAEVMIRATSMAGYASPIDFQIRYSNDGVHFTTAKSVTGESVYTPHEERLYSIP